MTIPIPQSHNLEALPTASQLTLSSSHQTSPTTEFKGGLERSSSLRTTTAGTTDTAVEERSRFKSVVLVMTCTFAMIVNSANNTAVAISLSSIGQHLDIRQTQLQWLVSAYPLSSGCLLLVFGRLADLYGRKKVFILGSSTLAAFTLGCGLANNSITLDILRGFQGIGAAATIPASLGILAHAFPPSRARRAAYATFASGAPIGAAFGNALGGALTQKTAETWRSPFFLQTGVTILCLLGGIFSFDADNLSSDVDRRVDWLGTMLVTTGLVLIVFVLGQGSVAPKGWKTPYIIGLLVAGILFVALFVLWQYYLEKNAAPAVPPCLHSTTATTTSNNNNNRSSGFSTSKAEDVLTLNVTWRLPPPLMKPSLWGRANGRFAAVMCIAFLTWCTFWSWVFWAQLYYQRYHGYTPLQTVVRLLPMLVSGITCNVIVASIVARVPMVYILATGTSGSALACLLFATIDPNAPYWAFGFPGAVVAVIGADFVFATGTMFISYIALPHEQSLAGGMFQTMTQLGTSFGVAITTVIFDAVSEKSEKDSGGQGGGRGGGEPGLESYKAAQWGCFAFGIVALTLAIAFFRGVGVLGKQKRNDGGVEEEKGRNSEDVEQPKPDPPPESSRSCHF